MTELQHLDITDGMILGDVVYDRIGAAILDGTLEPGQRLRDVELAEALGVSRTPVREALQRLERFGLVEIAAGRFTRVSEVDEHLREDTRAFIGYFVGIALRSALATCSDDRLASLLSLSDAVVDAANLREPAREYEATTNFTRAAIAASGNAVFSSLLRETAIALNRNMGGWLPFETCPDVRMTSYRTIRECVAARDCDGAEREVRRLHGLL